MEGYAKERVYRYLDIVNAEKSINKLCSVLFIFEAICCLVNCNNIILGISIPCASIILLCMIALGKLLQKDNKYLFIYLGVGMALWSLCWLLTALAFNHHKSFMVFIIIIELVAIPTSIVLVRKNAKQVLQQESVIQDSKYQHYMRSAASLGLISGYIVAHAANPAVTWAMLIIIAIVGACLFQYIASQYFYKHLLRSRYA